MAAAEIKHKSAGNPDGDRDSAITTLSKKLQQYFTDGMA